MPVFSGVVNDFRRRPRHVHQPIVSRLRHPGMPLRPHGVPTREIRFTVRLERSQLRSRQCGCDQVILRGKAVRGFRAVPIGRRPVWITLPIQKVECRACHVLQQIDVPFADRRRSGSQRLPPRAAVAHPCGRLCVRPRGCAAKRPQPGPGRLPLRKAISAFAIALLGSLGLASLRFALLGLSCHHPAPSEQWPTADGLSRRPGSPGRGPRQPCRLHCIRRAKAALAGKRELKPPLGNALSEARPGWPGRARRRYGLDRTPEPARRFRIGSAGGLRTASRRGGPAGAVPETLLAGESCSHAPGGHVDCLHPRGGADAAPRSDGVGR